MLLSEGIEGKFLEYMGKPLVRQDNELIFGEMSENYYASIMITGYKAGEKIKEDLPSQFWVSVLPTNGEPKVYKQSTTCTSLVDALDLANVWLDKANKA